GVERRILFGADADGSPMHFAKVAGPNYASVRDLATGMGGGTAALTLSPSICDVGTAIATVSLSDGTAVVRRDFELRVVSPSAPPDSVPLRMSDSGTAGAIALADLNADGNLDLIVTHQDRPTVSVFLGRGGGSFGPPSMIPA